MAQLWLYIEGKLKQVTIHSSWIRKDKLHFVSEISAVLFYQSQKKQFICTR
jgi:hypothetical protein